MDGERDFKKGQCLLRERNEVKFDFIRDESENFPIIVLCRVMRVSRSAYYTWKKRPGNLISAEALHLYHRMKVLFEQSRNSLGSREMMKKLRSVTVSD
jgi:putative transposase